MPSSKSNPVALPKRSTTLLIVLALAFAAIELESFVGTGFIKAQIVDKVFSHDSTWKFALLVLNLLWLGYILAISFMEAPVKFRAKTLTRPVAVDVGRTVFCTLNKFELIFSFASLIITSRLREELGSLESLLFTAVFLLVLEVLWLQPSLDQLAVDIINESPDAKNLGRSAAHHMYILSEVAKVVCLFVFAVKLGLPVCA